MKLDASAVSKTSESNTLDKAHTLMGVDGEKVEETGPLLETVSPEIKGSDSINNNNRLKVDTEALNGSEKNKGIGTSSCAPISQAGEEKPQPNVESAIINPLAEHEPSTPSKVFTNEDFKAQYPLSPPEDLDSPPPYDDDMGSFCTYHDLAPPPDGGWGWVIVMASFFCNMIVDGIAYAFGVFLIEFVNHFQESKAKVAWVGSLLTGCYLTVGPIVGALTNRFGCRKICIVGSVFGCLAFILSTFSTNVNTLMLTYGVLGGIGMGLIYLPAIVSVGYYFEKKRALATGISVCGSGVGTFLFPPFAQFLLDIYDWKGANLILSALILNCAVFGALMRPLEIAPAYDSEKPLLQRMAEEKRIQMENASIAGSAYFLVQHQDGTVERRLKYPSNTEPGVHSNFNLDQYGFAPETPLTPLPVIPSLPTIKEVKTQNSTPSPKDSSELNTESKEDVVELDNDTIDTSKGDPKTPLIPTSESSSNLNIKSNTNVSINSKLVHPSNVPIIVRSAIPPHVLESIPRNSSSPLLNPKARHLSSVTKNTSVPHFPDAFQKRYRHPGKMTNSNLTVNVDLRKLALQRRLSNSSYGSNFSRVRHNSNVSYEEIWMKMDGKKAHPRASSRHYLPPLARKDVFYSGSIMHLPEYQSQKDLGSYRGSVISFPMLEAGTHVDQLDHDEEPEQELGVCRCIPSSIRGVLATMLDVSLLKNPVFLLIGMSNAIGMLGFYVPFVYMIDAAVTKGVSEKSAALLISIIGITNTVGRVLAGWLSDLPWVNSLFVNNLCIFLSGLCVFVTPFCQSYASYVFIAVAFGLFVAAYISLTSIILVDMLGLENLTNAFGLLILFRGVASILGPPIAGCVFDATGNYDYSFYSAGGMLFLSSAISFVIPTVKQCSKSPNVDVEQVLSHAGPYEQEDIPEEPELEFEEKMAENDVSLPQTTTMPTQTQNAECVSSV